MTICCRIKDACLSVFQLQGNLQTCFWMHCFLPYGIPVFAHMPAHTSAFPSTDEHHFPRKSIQDYALSMLLTAEKILNRIENLCYMQEQDLWLIWNPADPQSQQEALAYSQRLCIHLIQLLSRDIERSRFLTEEEACAPPGVSSHHHS